MCRLTALLFGIGVVRTALAMDADRLAELDLDQLLDVKVTVTGASKYEQSQDEVPAAASVITHQEIVTFGWRTLADALSSLPGVTANYDRQYQYIGMRGFGLPGDFNTRLLLTVNGNRINDSVYHQAYIGRDFPIDLDLIERIEFIPGPGGAVYGENALLGVVNVVTRKGSQFDGAELAASVEHPQAAADGRVTWGRKLDNGIDMLLSTSARHASGENLYYHYGAAGISGVATGLDGERDREFYLQLAGGAWQFDMSYGNRRKEDPTGVFGSDPLVPGNYQQDGMVISQLQYNDAVADGKVHLSARLFAGAENYHAAQTYIGSPGLMTTASRWQGIELRTLAETFSSHKLMVGVELQRDSRQDQFFDDFSTPALDVSVPRSDNKGGIYAQDEWALTSALSTTLGFRLDHDSVTGSSSSPRAGLVWRESSDTTLKALYGVAHRPPNRYERDYSDGVSQAGNPTVDGETIRTVEFVADHQIGRDWTIRASVYAWVVDDLIALGTDPASGLPQYQNGGDARARGIELSSARQWAWGGRLRGSVTLQNAADASGMRLVNSPRALGKLNFSTPVIGSGVLAGYELQYVGDRKSNAGADLDAYFLSNLTVTAQSANRRWTLSTGIYNMFDARYDSAGAAGEWLDAVEQDRRSVRIKLTYRP